MRLVTFRSNVGLRVGVLDPATQAVVDLSAAAPDLPRDMLGIIALGGAGLARIKAALAAKPAATPLTQVKLAAPIPRPARNIFCVGKNYHEHAREFSQQRLRRLGRQGRDPGRADHLHQAASTVIGPGEPIPARLDPTELGRLRGRADGGDRRGRARHPSARAFEHVYGYTIVNDVTARTLAAAPPAVVHRQEHRRLLPDGAVHRDRGRGRRRRRHASASPASTARCARTRRVADLIFDIPTLIETISAGITLEPGDLIATGTPVGRRHRLQAAEIPEAGRHRCGQIEPIGELTNPVD